ncbi:tripartite tricarboxylate transporter TctB family protein [Mesorhizobium sp. 1B3]|uniref:tripartite tricarboxylate transporter TctB family protein n=1 Tax=Mesorhizobium sp. 1B3 TaxID=3243599 RepID=UPI003D99942E
MSEGGEHRPRQRPDRAALVVAAVLAIVAIVIGWSTAKMGGAASYSRIGPTTFPYVIAAAFFGLAVWTAVAAFRGEFPERERQELGPMVWIVGGLAAQMLLLKIAGFSIATGLLFAATARGFGRGPLWAAIPLGIVFAGLIWLVFAQGLSLALPSGPFEQILLRIVGAIADLFRGSV